MDYKDYQILKAEGANFWYKARIALIKFLLENCRPIPGRMKILDIGCGTGYEVKLLKKYGDVDALDKEAAALKGIKPSSGINILRKDIEKTELGKESYDMVCCFDLLEHLEKDGETINKIFHSLKNPGFFIFTVPAFQSLYSTHDIAMEHYRRYGKKRIAQLLEGSGFKVGRLGYWNTFLFPLEALIRILKRILLINLAKRKDFSSDMKDIPKPLNRILFYVLKFEVFLIEKNINIPFGLTIYGIALKK